MVTSNQLENVRAGLCAIYGDNVYGRLLSAICAYTAILSGIEPEMQKTQMLENVSQEIYERYGLFHTWRHYHNIMAGKYQPSPLLDKHIRSFYDSIYREIEKQEKDYRLRPVQVMCTQKQYETILRNLTTRGRADVLYEVAKRNEDTFNAL